MRLTWTERARIGAAAAALLLAVLSRGDAVALALALAACTWRPASAAAIAVSLGATSWSWGSSALESWAGGQAVLGPAGWLEPASSAAGAWLAAAALVLASPVPGWRTVSDRLVGGGQVATVEWPRRSLATTLATLALAAASVDVVAGPSASERGGVRAAATVVAVAVALALQTLRPRRARWFDAASLVAAAGALACATRSAPGWDGTFDGSAFRTGSALAIAMGAAVAVGTWAIGAMGQLRS